MFDFDALLSLSIVALGILGWAALVRIVAGREPSDLAAVFGRSWELTWPRGVQEEEPTAWRLDRLGRRPALVATAAPEPEAPCTCEDVAAA